MADGCFVLEAVLVTVLFRYTYKLGHRLSNGSNIWSKFYHFKSSPYPGQDSLQRIVIFGDMGKVRSSK